MATCPAGLMYARWTDGITLTRGAGTAGVRGTPPTSTAGAGDTNTVTMTKSGNDLLIADTTATISPLAGCTTVTANSVNCGSPTNITVDLGDQNDTLTMPTNNNF